ncbi:MAG: aldo/keto reductase [Oscillospiraceae bacterium]|jgi:predicted oxidoreductase|nr:aldo/keto reductase [Oscillospiraceae bacterium]
MKTIPLGKSGLQVPTVAVGCMRLNRLSAAEAETFLRTAISLGANFFDHADIYGGGACESLFAQALHYNADQRETLLIQSKCGIRQGRYDFSKEHILAAVDDSLARLRTDYLDVLLLHRPDALMEPEEVAEAFCVLRENGKVRHFGVSNQNPMQIRLLQKHLGVPIAANQLQLSVTNANMIEQGQHVNMTDAAAVNRDGSVLDFCRLEDITIQPWSPFQYGFFEGVFLDNPKFPELNQAISEVAAAHGVTNTAIAVAWLLRHPANMQPVTGTMNIGRLRDCVAAADVRLSREEWYQIFRAAGHTLP